VQIRLILLLFGVNCAKFDITKLRNKTLQFLLPFPQTGRNVVGVGGRKKNPNLNLKKQDKYNISATIDVVGTKSCFSSLS
jgi:hypothetical protein